MRVRRRIAILNRSVLVTNEEVDVIRDALQKELDGKFAEAWGTGALLKFVPDDDLKGWKDHWNIVIVDTMEVAGALGYHDLTPEGLPVGYVGVEVCRQYSESVSAVLSHEIFEMLADPDINQIADNGYGKLVWYENCDPVQGTTLKVDGVELSNYVYPTWFVPSLHDAEGRKFDRLGACDHPFQLAPGGYIGYTETWPPNWKQVFGSTALAGNKSTFEDRPLSLSRRTRRQVPRNYWQRSLP